MAGGGGGPARRAGGRAARVSTGERVRDVFRTERDEGEGEGLLLGHSGWVEAVSWERVGGEVFRGSARGAKKSRVAAFRDALEEAREVVTANGVIRGWVSMRSVV